MAVMNGLRKQRAGYVQCILLMYHVVAPKIVTNIVINLLYHPRYLKN